MFLALSLIIQLSPLSTRAVITQAGLKPRFMNGPLVFKLPEYEEKGFEAIIRSETPDYVWKSIEMYQKSYRKDLERNNSHKMPEIAILLK